MVSLIKLLGTKYLIMKLIPLILLLSCSCGSALATEFKLMHFARYGEAPGMELSLRPNSGNKISEIFGVLKFFRKEFYIRLIGESSEVTNTEIINFYRKNIPKELDVALRSSGNMHNPALLPLKKNFPEALKSTTMYKELEKELNAKGYVIKGISFEKFHIHKGIVPIPDVYLECVKSA